MDSDLTGFFEQYRRQRHIQTELHDILTRQETLVSALDDVNAAVAALTAQVQSAVAAIGSQGLSAGEAETIVADLNGLAQQIDSALNPAPAPAPAG